MSPERAEATRGDQLRGLLAGLDEATVREALAWLVVWGTMTGHQTVDGALFDVLRRALGAPYVPRELDEAHWRATHDAVWARRERARTGGSGRVGV